MSKAIYNRLNGLNTKRVAKAEAANTVVSLAQSDFVNGTYNIDTPGVYRLSENIAFNPNSLNLAKTVGLPGQAANPSASPYDTGMPTDSQFIGSGGPYSPQGYGLGFFCAVSIICEDVTLDLNGYTIEQHAEHALQQKFYANIELADQPFIPKEGPHDFGNVLNAGKNVCIMNGILGNSSHHQIHGNDNVDILIKDMVFEGHEVASVALNGVKNLAVVNCRSNGSRQITPILAIFSAARFLRPYVDALEVAYLGDNSSVDNLLVDGIYKTPVQIKAALKTALENVFDDVVTNAGVTGGFIDKATHLAEWSLFSNPFKHIDGNTYGFLVNRHGPAVLGFPTNRDTKSSDVYLEDVTLNAIETTVNEVPGLTAYDNGNVYGFLGFGAQNDAVGAVFQTQNKDADGNWVTVNNMDAGAGNGKYVGNVVANAQLLVTKNKNKAALANLDVTRLSISQEVLDWAENSTNLNDVVVAHPEQGFLGNGDGMFHVNKGAIGFKLDGVERLTAKNCVVNGITNNGALGTELAGDYSDGKSHPLATYNGYGGCNVRGFSMSSAAEVKLIGCEVRNADSKYGHVFGFDVHQSSDAVELENCTVSDIAAGSAATIDEYLDNPTPTPVACGYHVDGNGKNVTLNNVYMKGTNTSVGAVTTVNVENNVSNLNVGSQA